MCRPRSRPEIVVASYSLARGNGKADFLYSAANREERRAFSDGGLIKSSSFTEKRRVEFRGSCVRVCDGERMTFEMRVCVRFAAEVNVL